MSTRNSRTSALLGVSLGVLASWAAPQVIAQNESAGAALYTGLPTNVFLKSWLVLGPVPVAAETEPAPDEDTQKKAFATDLLAAVGGETGVRPQAGATCRIAERDFKWQRLDTTNDIVSLDGLLGRKEFVVAYAWADLELAEDLAVWLGLGSDDAVKLWVNGKLAHEKWAARPTVVDEDLLQFDLRKGRNSLLLKVQNLSGDWSFACRRLGQDALEDKLVSAAGRGDLDEVKRLATRGVNVNARGKSGLTAWQRARVLGHKEVAEFVASRGANDRAPLPPPEELVDRLFNNLVHGEVPGAATLVARDGRVLLAKGYGLANLGHRAPITPQTKFRIGSITKQFTAAAILKLQEQGKLSVHDKLTKFIPDYPRGDEVTLHHLLTHTSGIHPYTSKPDFMQSVRLSVTPEELIKSFKQDPYDFDPGKKWAYNNSGFFLLGYVIEKVSGQTYGEFLKQQFFVPLGMRDTGVHEAREVLAQEAEGYAFEGGQVRKAENWDMSRAGGAGALYSTVEDLHRWNEGLFGGTVLGEASLKAAFAPVLTAEDPKPPKEEGYGYGWAIGRLRGLREVAHGGGLNGFVSYLLRLPAERFTVVVLANAAPPMPGLSPEGAAREIAQLCLWDKLPWRETPKVDPTVAAKSYEGLAGRYDYGAAVMSVTREGDHLYAQLTGQPRFEVFPKSQDTFFWKVVEAEVTFTRNAQGEVIEAIHRQGGQTIRAPRLPARQEVKLDPAQCAALAGRYDYGEGKAILTVTCEGGRLFAQLTGQPKFEIFPQSETNFFWKVVNAQITFLKDAQGKVTKAIHEQGGRRIEAPRL